MPVKIGSPAYLRQGEQKAKEALREVKDLVPEVLGDGEGVNLEQAFQLFTQFCGDAVRTGHVLGISGGEVLRLADQHGWNKKLAAILELKKAGKPADVERGLSRAICFVQANKMRMVIERILEKFYLMSSEELFQQAFVNKTVTDKNGAETVTTSVNTKPFADLATAMEKIHQLCYIALGDTVTERAARKEKASEDNSVSATQIHTLIASAMSEHPFGRNEPPVLNEQQPDA